MERPSGVPSYRYGPGASQRRDLEYGLLEAVFEDRAALEAVMAGRLIYDSCMYAT